MSLYHTISSGLKGNILNRNLAIQWTLYFWTEVESSGREREKDNDQQVQGNVWKCFFFFFQWNW